MDSNVIFAHLVYKIKVEDGEKKPLKSRLCPHVNKDRMKGKIRNHSVTASFEVIRILISTDTLFKLSIGYMEMKGDYIHRSTMKRTIY